MMTRDLSGLFPSPLPAVVIEQRTGITGWPEYQVTIFREGHDEPIGVFETLSAAKAAAAKIASEQALPVSDLTGDDYA